MSGVAKKSLGGEKNFRMLFALLINSVCAETGQNLCFEGVEFLDSGDSIMLVSSTEWKQTFLGKVNMAFFVLMLLHHKQQMHRER